MDWQSIIVALSVLAALAFAGRRGWVRLQSVVCTKTGVSSSCASACGGCGGPKRVPVQKGVYQNLSGRKPSR